MVADLAASTAGGASRDDHGDLAANQIGRQLRQSIELTLRPAVFDRHVLALDIAGILEALTKAARRSPDRQTIGSRNPITGIARLLRARGKRPGPPAAEQMMKSRRLIVPPEARDRHRNNLHMISGRW